ncbi:MAG TPA: hypothetical protein VIV34_07130, partial [Pseudolabrys sp.]
MDDEYLYYRFCKWESRPYELHLRRLRRGKNSSVRDLEENMTMVSRRGVLGGAVAAAASAAAPLHAATPQSGNQAPGYYRYRVGSIE